MLETLLGPGSILPIANRTLHGLTQVLLQVEGELTIL